MEEIIEEINNVEIDDFTKNILLPHQISHVQSLIRALKKHGIAIDSSDTGSGKSYGAGAVCRILGLNPFFIGLKTGIINLHNVCEKFEIEVLGNVNYETLKNGKYYPTMEDFYSERREKCPFIEIIRGPCVDIITGVIKKQANGMPKIEIKEIKWTLPNNTLVIFDEAHKGKNGKSSVKESDNSKLLVSIKKYISKEKNINCMLLSATISDRIECFDAITYMLGFYRPYAVNIYAQYIRRIQKKGNALEQIHKNIFPEYGARMSIKKIKSITGNDVFKDNDIQAAIYPVSEEVAAEIERNHREIQEELSAIRSTGISRGFGKIIKLWRKIEVLKIPAAVNAIKGFLLDGKSVVVFNNFTKTKDLLYDHLVNDGFPSEKIGTIHGKQSGEERQDQINKFQTNKTEIIICQMAAGSTTISLHDLNGKPRVSVIFPSWSAINMKQSFGRIYRAESKSDAIQRILYCKYFKGENLSTCIEGKDTLSIEEKICKSLNEKLQNIETINDGILLGENVDLFN